GPARKRRTQASRRYAHFRVDQRFCNTYIRARYMEKSTDPHEISAGLLKPIRLAAIPSVHAVLSRPDIACLGTRWRRDALVEAVPAVLTDRRQMLLSGKVSLSTDALHSPLALRVKTALRHQQPENLYSVINAKGVALH